MRLEFVDPSRFNSQRDWSYYSFANFHFEKKKEKAMLIYRYQHECEPMNLIS